MSTRCGNNGTRQTKILCQHWQHRKIWCRLYASSAWQTASQYREHSLSKSTHQDVIDKTVPQHIGTISLPPYRHYWDFCFIFLMANCVQSVRMGYSTAAYMRMRRLKMIVFFIGVKKTGAIVEINRDDWYHLWTHHVIIYGWGLTTYRRLRDGFYRYSIASMIIKGNPDSRRCRYYLVNCTVWKVTVQ